MQTLSDPRLIFGMLFRIKKEMRNILILVVLLAFGCSEKPNNSNKISGKTNSDQVFDHREYGFKEMLTNWSTKFAEKIDSNYTATVNFKLSDLDKEIYQVEFKDKSFKLNQGQNDSSNMTFESTLKHYNKIYKGDMTAMTSMGQATSSDPIPLIPKLEKPITDNPLNDFLYFSQRFFNLSNHDKVKLGLEHSRVVHGGNAIPIFYQKSDEFGVRSAWYQINKGEQVNDIGDTNPFPQYFIITGGNGLAKIGNDTISIKTNEAYYVAPQNDHVFWNENDEPLTIIFMAYGKGA